MLVAMPTKNLDVEQLVGRRSAARWRSQLNAGTLRRHDMIEERSLKIVRNHRPMEVPPGSTEAALTATVAVVLSTFRSDSPEMVLDHPLWLACMEEVGRIADAENTEVCAEAPPRFLDRFRKRPKGPTLGTLDGYGRRLLSEPSTPEWQLVFWRKGDRLVAAAACEPWYLIGGPAIYHDTYTSCIFVNPSIAPLLAKALELRVQREGAWLEEIVDASDSGAA